MILKNTLESQFLRNELRMGLCNSFGEEPKEEDYQRITLNSDDFLFNITTKEYESINTIFFCEALFDWGKISHVCIFNSENKLVGFEEYMDKKIYNITKFTTILFVPKNLKILFVE